MSDDTRHLPPYPGPYAGSPDPTYGRPAADAPTTWYGATATAERPAPPFPPAPTSPQPPRGSGGWRRRAATGVTLVAVALGSGATGAVVATQLDDDPAGVRTSVAAQVTGGTQPTERLAQVAAAVRPSVVSVLVQAAGGSGNGSGVVLRSDGTILTNNHVVAPAADGGGTVRVRFSDGRTVEADLVGRAPGSDLAVIRARGVSDAKPATLGSTDDLNIGDSVLAIGSPLGLDGSVSAGIVSALHRPVELGQDAQLADAVQTDAAINPGNSGGALVDARGRVIGINTAIATLGGGLGGQSGSIGLGFAIPIDDAKRVADALIAGKQPQRALLGVRSADAPGGGALLDSVTPDSAAAKAGLKAGDVVTRVDDRTVTDAGDLTAAIRSHEPGETIQITVRRDGSDRSVSVTLGSADA